MTREKRGRQSRKNTDVSARDCEEGSREQGSGE